jgi:predicted transcriptional regulator
MNEPIRKEPFMADTPFQTMQEVDNYLSGDTVACLICGKSFQTLNCSHLGSHGITHDEYRIRFGIPFNRSLTSAPSRAKSRALIGPERVEWLERSRTARMEALLHRRANRPLAPAVIDQRRKNGVRSPATVMVSTACPICGCEIVTTALAAAQAVRCAKCVTPATLKARETYWHKKAVAESAKHPIVHPPFETIAEVDDYLSEDTITCLICDARLQRLDKHLSLHRMSVDEYRVRFNIPFDRSLMSAPCRAHIRANLARVNRKNTIQFGPLKRWQSPWQRRLAS